MATITGRANIDLKLAFVITETEARALSAMVGYGYDGFIETFKKHMGEHYMRGHEGGLKLFFESVRGIVDGELHKLDKARAIFLKPESE